MLSYAGLGLVAELMPVEGWNFLLNLFTEREPNTFYRVVLSENSSDTTRIIMLVIIGLSLIILSRVRPCKNSTH